MSINFFPNFFQKLQRQHQTVVYLAPHQDDELLSMGIDIIQSVAAGKVPHVYLFTDGSKSTVRFRICNGQACPFHEGIHQHDLTIPKFVAARDREFTDSCLALGVKPENIHILPARSIDGALSIESAEQLILSILSSHPKNVTVCTISPMVGNCQHTDHRNLGLAALNLYRKGRIRNLRLFVEPYCLPSFLSSNPNLKLMHVYPSGDAHSILKTAV